jgi:L-lactate dehydrogenase complex protein LldE
MRVGLFVTCLTDTFYPRAGEAVVRILRHYGCEVVFPAGQTCCGQPAYNSGFHAEAACLIRRMAPLFAECERVVTPSASCAVMVKRHGPELVAGTPVAEAVDRLAHKTWEFTTFLRDELHVNVAECLRFDEPVTFHYSCHARDVYSLADLRDWLGGVHGQLRIPQRPDLCCGFGGVFAVEFPELSGRMAGDKIDELTATGAELVVCNESACALQIAGAAHRRGLRLRLRHIAECLAESLGLMEPAP